MVSCESARGHVAPATHAVNVLAPTGETISDDTGKAPVLRTVLSVQVCADCAAALEGLALPGGHVDLEELDPEIPDAIDAAKAALELAGFEVLHRDEDGFTALIPFSGGARPYLTRRGLEAVAEAEGLLR